MPTYTDLVELAKICARQARTTSNREVAQELRRLAKEYQKKAADLDGEELPDIG
jgi:nitrate reductase assembly molybdenum cofactor insertion protein NarJ